MYGEEEFARLYGEIEAVAEERVRAMADNEELAWGGRVLRFLDTPGHASHHCCIHDSATNGVFTGDAFGLGRNERLRPGPSFVIASSAPPDFDAAEAKKSARRIVDTGAQLAYLTHYGALTDLEKCADQLVRSLDALQAIVEDALAQEIPDEELQAFCERGVENATREHLRACGVADVEADYHWLESDTAIDAMGLAVAVQRRRK